MVHQSTSYQDFVRSVVAKTLDDCSNRITTLESNLNDKHFTSITRDIRRALAHTAWLLSQYSLQFQKHIEHVPPEHVNEMYLYMDSTNATVLSMKMREKRLHVLKAEMNDPATKQVRKTRK